MRADICTVGRVVICCFETLVSGYTAKSVMHGYCVAKPTVTFLASEHHHPLTSIKLQRHTGVSALAKATVQWCLGRT